MGMRKITVDGDDWLWQAAPRSGCVMVRNPENKSHKIELSTMIPGYVFDPNEEDKFLSITPGMVAKAIQELKAK